MITVAEQSFSREELERRFLSQHASFASGWTLERVARTTTWTSPGQTLRIQTTLAPHEYVERGNAGGYLGESLTWDQTIYKRQGADWVPAPVRVKPQKTRA